MLDLAGSGGLLVSSSSPLPAGQALTLRVSALQPQVMFEAITPPPASVAESAAPAAPASAAPALSLQPGQQLAAPGLGASTRSPPRVVWSARRGPGGGARPPPRAPGGGPGGGGGGAVPPGVGARPPAPADGGRGPQLALLARAAPSPAAGGGHRPAARADGAGG